MVACVRALEYSDYNAGKIQQLIFEFSEHSEKIGAFCLEDTVKFRGCPYGIYVLLNNDGEIVYVGKATGRDLTGRISSHCDPRDGDDGWFNNVVKKLLDWEEASDFKDALEKFYNLKIIFFAIKSSSKDKDKVNKTEKELISILKDTNNRIPWLNNRSKTAPSSHDSRP